MLQNSWKKVRIMRQPKKSTFCVFEKNDIFVFQQGTCHRKGCSETDHCALSRFLLRQAIFPLTTQAWRLKSLEPPQYFEIHLNQQ